MTLNAYILSGVFGSDSTSEVKPMAKTLSRVKVSCFLGVFFMILSVSGVGAEDRKLIRITTHPVGETVTVDDPLRMLYRRSSLFFNVSYLWRI